MEQLKAILPYLFTIIAGVFVLSGFLFGLIRGWKRAVIRLGWLAACFVISLWITNLVTPLIINANISFLKMEYNGQTVSTLKEYAALFAADMVKVASDDLGNCVDFLVAVASLFMNAIIFVSVFFALKGLSVIFFWIVNAICIHDKGEGKGRLIGAAVGAVSGILVSVVALSPVAGYVSLYDEAREALSQAGYSEQTDKINEYLEYYKKDLTISFFKSIGIEKLQLFVFDSVSVSQYDNTRLKLADEKDDLIKLIPVIAELTEKNGDEQKQNYGELVKTISTLLESDLVYCGLKEFSPLIANKIETSDTSEDEIAEQLKVILVSTLNRIPELEKENIIYGLDSVTRILDETAGKDFESMNYTALGIALDDSVASGFIAKEDVDKLASILAEKSFGSITEEDTLYETSQAIINGLQSGVTSYEKELTAIGKLVEVKKLTNNDFGFESDGSALGKIIDDTIAINAEIINKDLIVDLIGRTMDDSVADSLGGEFSAYIQTIKSRLDLVNSYENEFGYLSKLVTISKSDFSIENLNKPDESGKTLGEKLDEISQSILVGDIPLDVIGTKLNEYAAENNEYSDILDKVIANYSKISKESIPGGKAGGYTYTDIIGAISETYTAITDPSLRITGKSDFSTEIAAEYDKKLGLLQNNILMRENATKALAKHLATEVKGILLKPEFGIFPTLAKVAVKTQTYIDYLSSADENEHEPYTDTVNLFADKNGNTAQTQENLPAGTRINKPFSYLAELLKG